MRTPLTIIEAKERFQAWRLTKSKGEQIPAELWGMVRQILSNPAYSRSTAGGALGISTSQLRRKFPEHFLQSKKNVVKQEKFVNASLTPLITAASSIATITIERPNGIKLRISAPNQEQFSTLIKFFME